MVSKEVISNNIRINVVRPGIIENKKTNGHTKENIKYLQLIVLVYQKRSLIVLYFFYQKDLVIFLAK